MKSKFFKQSVSILMAVLTMISVLTVSVSAEELLPEECGGAICVTDEITATGSTFDEPVTTDGNCGGAIYASDELTGTEITFTSHENSEPADDSAANINIGTVPVEDEPGGSAESINISTVPVPDETNDESQLNVETPRDTENPEPPTDTESPESPADTEIPVPPADPETVQLINQFRN